MLDPDEIKQEYLALSQEWDLAEALRTASQEVLDDLDAQMDALCKKLAAIQSLATAYAIPLENK